MLVERKRTMLVGKRIMTSEDIINQLDPDMIYCTITNKWIKLNEPCTWQQLTILEDNFWSCVDHCPKISHSPYSIY